MKRAVTSAGVKSNGDCTVSSLGVPERNIRTNLSFRNTDAATVLGSLTLKAGSKDFSVQISTMAVGESDIIIFTDGVDIVVFTVKLRGVEKSDPLEYCDVI